MNTDSAVEQDASLHTTSPAQLVEMLLADLGPAQESQEQSILWFSSQNPRPSGPEICIQFSDQDHMKSSTEDHIHYLTDSCVKDQNIKGNLKHRCPKSRAH
jgi:hypothetical protein